MPTTLGDYFEAWKRNHVCSDTDLAEYLGLAPDRLAALAAEPIEPANDEAGAVNPDAGAMPRQPLRTDLDPLADRHGATHQRLRNVIDGRY
jgi:hypothetical protein